MTILLKHGLSAKKVWPIEVVTEVATKSVKNRFGRSNLIGKFDIFAINRTLEVIENIWKCSKFLLLFHLILQSFDHFIELYLLDQIEKNYSKDP